MAERPPYRPAHEEIDVEETRPRTSRGASGANGASYPSLSKDTSPDAVSTSAAEGPFSRPGIGTPPGLR